MEVLITGAGMIGCHTAAELQRRGHEVTVLDLAPREEYVRRVAGAEVRLVRGDVRELPALVEVMGAVRPQVVVHTAAMIGGSAQQVPYRGFQVNVGGTVNVAEAARLSGVRRLVHASTQGVHDLSRPQLVPIDESVPTDGAGRMYQASKVACEQLLRVYAGAYGFELALLRFSGVFGYGHFVGGSGVGRTIFEMVQGALEGREARMGAGLAGSDEFAHVKDIARGVAAAACAEQLPHTVYHLGSGILSTPDAIAAALQRLVPGTTVSRSEPPRPDPFPRLQPMDLSRARAELGYEPQYDLEAGLADLMAEMRRG